MSDRLCDVVIPTRNRPAALRRCLVALADQTATSFGIIIVDDCSDDPLNGIVDDVVAKATFQVSPILLRLEQRSGPARAALSFNRSAATDRRWCPLITTRFESASWRSMSPTKRVPLNHPRRATAILNFTPPLADDKRRTSST